MGAYERKKKKIEDDIGMVQKQINLLRHRADKLESSMKYRELKTRAHRLIVLGAQLEYQLGLLYRPQLRIIRRYRTTGSQGILPQF